MADQRSERRAEAFEKLMSAVAGLELWIDSGTLLAIHREGRLLEWDGDIDLSCWDTALDSVIARRADFEALGYRVAVRRVAGAPYKVKLTPRLAMRRAGAMHVDISIYRRRGEWAISPGIYRYRPRTPVWEFPNLIGHTVRELALMAWLGAGSRRDVVVSRPRLEMRLFTWCVPADMFDTHSTIGTSDCPMRVPEDIDRYLTFRYGDWRTPRRDWDYYNDDRSVLRVRPEATLSGIGLPAAVDEWEHRPHGR